MGTKKYEIYATYKEHRETGKLDLEQSTVRITSGALDGNVYSSPTQAAMAIVSHHNPTRDNPNTNGWSFWKLEKSDEPIASLRE